MKKLLFTFIFLLGSYITSAQIVANNDVGSFVNGLIGGTSYNNVLINDTLNGNPVSLSSVSLTFVSSTNPNITLNLGSGSVVVAPGTQAGNYVLTYQICDSANTSNCDQATVTVSVTAAAIDAVNDSLTITGTGNFGNVLANDSINGVSFLFLSQVNLTIISSSSPLITFSGNAINIAEGLPTGNYTLNYQICELLNPTNCDTAQVTINYTACSIGTPIINSIIQPNCTDPHGSVNLSGLPSGNWTIGLALNGAPLLPISGSGTTTVLTNLSPGIYLMVVNTGSCGSQGITFTINQVGGISVNMQGNYTDFNSDGITNVGDLINYQFTVYNNSCDPITTIYLENNSLNIAGSPINSLASSSNDATTFTASYVLTQQDINAGNVTNSIVVHGTLNGNAISNNTTTNTSLNLSDGIKLNAFIDTNSNGIQDGTEQNVNVGNFYFQMNSGTIHTITSSNGIYYLYESNSTNTYTIGYTLTGSNSAYYSIATSTYSNISINNGSGITTYNFPITELPHNDLGVAIFPIGSPRPGFTYSNQIQITNYGNQTISSRTLTFTYANSLSISVITISGTTLTANGFTYSFSNLQPGNSLNIIVYLNVPLIPTVALGQSLTNSVVVSTPVSEVNTVNNVDSVTQIVVGSYDPNDKQESHGGRIVHSTFTSDDYLTYTIRFENTGTANAINVKVDDVLDSQLDENSIRMVAASHDYVLERVGSNLTWKFNGINLPPSVPDTQIGHGFIAFQIKPKAGYAIGDIIPNTAEIYFDFNPAIVTNTCTTEFVAALGNDNFALSNLTYHPNPVQNSLTISNEKRIDSVEITSVLGQQMLSKKVNSLQTEVDTSHFANGVYFVKITSGEAVKIVKIVKE